MLACSGHGCRRAAGVSRSFGRALSRVIEGAISGARVDRRFRDSVGLRVERDEMRLVRLGDVVVDDGRDEFMVSSSIISCLFRKFGWSS